MEYHDARDDDTIGYVMDAYLRGAITREESESLSYLLKKAGNTETYRRARQLVQAKYPELWPTKEKARQRNELESRARITRWSSVAQWWGELKF